TAPTVWAAIVRMLRRCRGRAGPCPRPSADQHSNAKTRGLVPAPTRHRNLVDLVTEAGGFVFLAELDVVGGGEFEALEVVIGDGAFDGAGDAEDEAARWNLVVVSHDGARGDDAVFADLSLAVDDGAVAERRAIAD